MATINITAVKDRVARFLTPWFSNHEQDAISECVARGAQEAAAAVQVDTDALQAQFTNLYSPNGADAIGIADAGGYYSGTSVEDALQQIGPAIGAGPFQPLDADLTAISALATTGVVQRTGASTWAAAPLVAADIPNLDTSKLTTGILTAVRGGTGIGTYTAGNYINAATTTTLQQRTPAQVKTDLSLNNVDNTSDVNKPVSTAQATADGLRVLKAGDTMTGGLTISMANPVLNITNTAGPFSSRLAMSGSTLFVEGPVGSTVTVRGLNGGGGADMSVQGTVTSTVGNFIGGSSVVLATTGANVVVLRPNGVGSVTGQMTLDAAGTATTVNFVSTSDRDQKKEIVYRDCTKNLQPLRMANWKWKSNNLPGVGVIAQDVLEIAPEYVFESPEGVMGIDKAGLALEVAMTVKEQIHQLTERIAQLESAATITVRPAK